MGYRILGGTGASRQDEEMGVSVLGGFCGHVRKVRYGLEKVYRVLGEVPPGEIKGYRAYRGY